MSQSVAAIAAAAGGFASNARAQANSVTGTPNRVKMRWSRHQPDPGAVFEHALGAEVAAGLPASVLALSISPVSRDAVAGRVGQLRAFLEIDHEIDRDARLARPVAHAAASAP